MLLSEELLLLLLDDEKGTASNWTIGRDQALAGALLLDLLEAGRIEERPGEKLATVDSPPLAPAAAAAYAAMRDEERSAKDWVSRLPGRVKPITGTIAESLVRVGVLDERRHKTLGLFGSSLRYPEVDAAPEEELRARLRRVLVDGEEPDSHTASLLALLVPLDLVPKLVAKDDRGRAKARAKAVAERGPVGDAVRATIQQQVAGAIVAATVAATAGGAAASA